MHKRVVTGFLAAAVVGGILAPATAALAAPTPNPAQQEQAGSQFTVRVSTDPDVVTLPERGEVEVRVRAHVSGDGLRAVRARAGSEVIELARLDGTGPMWGTTLKIKADEKPGKRTVEVFAYNQEGRIRGEGSATFEVKAAAVGAPEVVSVSSRQKDLVLTRDGARLSVDAVVKNAPAKVVLRAEGDDVAMKRVSGDTYRGDLRLERDTEPGRVGFQVRAYTHAGSLAGTRSGTVNVRRDVVVSGFNASPEPARRGGKIQVKGTVKGLSDGGWSYTPVREGQVRIMFKPKGWGSYTTLKTTWVNRGTFKVTFRAKSSGTWKAVYTGTGELAAKSSHEDYVRVR
ncbi:hypothetical protein [Nonomuraea typhae]|uniref:Adhesin domain-containing protein n=1 Tax=Nonomuraea typhae TaxID=2603600 RepID=A0ABW7YRU8_9ACTN